MLLAHLALGVSGCGVEATEGLRPRPAVVAMTSAALLLGAARAPLPTSRKTTEP